MGEQFDKYNSFPEFQREFFDKYQKLEETSVSKILFTTELTKLIESNKEQINSKFLQIEKLKAETQKSTKSF